MCGIVGYYCDRVERNLAGALGRSVESLAHRGPDDAGIFTAMDGRIGLGHRRLSVLDLSRSGRQPMESEDGRAAIVYNGEVYNFAQIREQLTGCGYSFKSGTDTEVILKAYLKWGIGCLERFIGMFAFCILDRRDMSLFLARDRLGIKPLYYFKGQGTFIFASELKAMMAFPDFPRDVNKDALALYLHYQYVPAPHSIFQDTFKLAPGHYMKFDGRDISIKRYWDPPNTGDALNDEHEVIQKLDELITCSVKDRLVSDVPLGALLSGGIDSTLVAAILQKQADRPVKTFTIGFRESAYDEAPWASQVAGYLGTEHTELYISPRQAMDVIPELPAIYDEPFADTSAIPSCLVSRLARSEVIVALSGDGGDEQFCGYVRYWATKSMSGVLNQVPQGVRSVLARIIGAIPFGWVEKSYLPLRDMLPKRFQMANLRDKWQKMIAILKEGSLHEIYRATVCLWSMNELREVCGIEITEGTFERMLKADKSGSILSRLMLTDLLTYLPDCMLTKVDRASMAVGLEVRVPLLDHRIVEFSTHIHDGLKYRDGEGKYILKRLLSRYVPSYFFERPKMGFAVPIDSWLRGELKNMLLDYLSWERLTAEGLFSPLVVHRSIKEHMTGVCNHQHRLWAILMWEMWRERWLDGGRV